MKSRYEYDPKPIPETVDTEPPSCQVKAQIRSDGNKIIVLVRKELEDFWGADQCENDEEIIELIKEDIVAFLENASFIVERSA